ncbi:MAG TPA: hypothetical protein VK683_10955 [Rhizomicrobium sp.]|jgi:hypothetical protein|nr:hypothetical protein [Rhizomicrobium sp.]
MGRILTVTLFALMLAGCASVPGYDKSAVPNATAALRQVTAMCEKEQTASKYTDCEVAAQHDFVVAIHLQKMDAFDAYAAKIMALAADWDAGRVSRKQLAARAASIRNDYSFACNCGLGGRRGGASFSYDITPSIIMPRP